MKRPLLLLSLVLLAGWPGQLRAADDDLAVLKTQIARNHDRALTRLQEWIRRPAIAAENRGFPEGAEYLITLLKEVGFQQAVRIDTDGKPGVFATLDAGAPITVGVYFMYDVKQYDSKEWSSPPLDAALVDRPGLGKVIVGRGAVNQKGPESAFLAALDAFRTAGKKLPVNLVLVAEGEEEIGSPHIAQIVLKPEVSAALAKCVGVFLPHTTQELDGNVTVNLGAKGVIEVELTASGLAWGRGPTRDTHSSNKAMVDSPVWRLVQALATLVSPDGNTPMIDGFMDQARPLNTGEKAMIATAARRRSEMQYKVATAAQKWIDDLPFLAALERLESQPTVNIEGIYGGYTGPGGKTILPHRASAKLDLRLVPDMTAADALAKLKAHLVKRGYGDIEVKFTGGYSPTTTSVDAPLIQAQVAVLKRAGIEPVLWPRLAGSYPGFIFTDAPLKLAAGHFGLGNGGGAHAPDEYFLIESANPKVQGFDGAALSYVEYLYELAKAAPPAARQDSPVAPPLPGSVAVVTAPLMLKDGAISQPAQTEVTSGGKAIFTFTVPREGNYVIHAMVNAPDEDSNSFFLNIDAQPEDPLMIWDMEVTKGFEGRIVSWRGNGDSFNVEFAPKIFKLTAGEHKLIIVGREPAFLRSVSIRPVK